MRESDLSSLAGGSSGGSIIPFGGKSLVVQEPVGVVAAFTAYNFALACFAQKSAPALVAGCTVVVKVPEQNPLSSFVLAELAEEVGFPPGALNFVATYFFDERDPNRPHEVIHEFRFSQLLVFRVAS